MAAVAALALAAATGAVVASAQSASGLRGSDTFDDIPEGHWADEAVGWAVATGITSGTSDTEFSPNGPLNRAQMVTFLHRFYRYLVEASEALPVAVKPPPDLIGCEIGAPRYNLRSNGDIVALVDIRDDVPAGTVGGKIQSESNLSQCTNHTAWVYPGATVAGSAYVYDNATVSDTAQVYGNAKVYGEAQIYDRAKVYGEAQIYDRAQVYGDGLGRTLVYDNAKVYGNAEVATHNYRAAWVFGNAEVFGFAVIVGGTASGFAKVCADTHGRGSWTTVQEGC